MGSRPRASTNMRTRLARRPRRRRRSSADHRHGSRARDRWRTAPHRAATKCSNGSRSQRLEVRLSVAHVFAPAASERESLTPVHYRNAKAPRVVARRLAYGRNRLPLLARRRRATSPGPRRRSDCCRTTGPPRPRRRRSTTSRRSRLAGRWPGQPSIVGCRVHRPGGRHVRADRRARDAELTRRRLVVVRVGENVGQRIAVGIGLERHARRQVRAAQPQVLRRPNVAQAERHLLELARAGRRCATSSR